MIQTDEIYLGYYEGDPNERLLKYYLSDDIHEIEDIINKRITNVSVNLKDAKWEYNSNVLAEKVKDMMNKRNLDYSLTFTDDSRYSEIIHVAVNWRKNGEWLFFGGIITEKEFFTYQEAGAE